MSNSILPRTEGGAKRPLSSAKSGLSSTLNTRSLAIIPICSTLNLSAITRRGRKSRFKQRIKDATSEIEARINELKEKLKTDVEHDERMEAYDELGDLNKQLYETIAETLDELLPEAFAVVKDTCRRLVGKTWEAAGQKITWNMVPYDVQLIGGMVLHRGKIAEMATGEGKTLVATLPLYLNALAEKGVHLVTVNDYLAKRDSDWMGEILLFHGIFYTWHNKLHKKALISQSLLSLNPRTKRGISDS